MSERDTPVGPWGPDQDKWVQDTYGKTAQELADEAQEGHPETEAAYEAEDEELVGGEDALWSIAVDLHDLVSVAGRIAETLEDIAQALRERPR